jgi:hypothetical protein
MTSIAFDKHSVCMFDPSVYVTDKRPNHPLDNLLAPRSPSDSIDKCGSGEPCNGDLCPLPENRVV